MESLLIVLMGLLYIYMILVHNSPTEHKITIYIFSTRKYLNMRKMYKMMISLVVTSILMSPVIAIDNQSINSPNIYKILIDQNYGFFRIYEMYDNMLAKDINSKNGILNISKGDTIIFVSNTVSDNTLTIVSEEQLWDDEDGILKYSGREFSHTFYNFGIYNIYIKERPLLKQRIIVGPIDMNTTDKIDINETKLNMTNNTEVEQINATKTISTKQNLTNMTKSNLSNMSDKNNATIVKQNSVPSKSSTLIRTVALLTILTLSVIYLMRE